MEKKKLDQLQTYLTRNFEITSYEIINDGYILVSEISGRKKILTLAKDVVRQSRSNRDYFDLYPLGVQEVVQLIKAYVEVTNVALTGPLAKVSPEELRGFTLCRSLEYSQSMQNIPMYLINPSGYISELPASEYIIRNGIEQPLMVAQGLLPVYDPFREPGIYKSKTVDGFEIDCVNSYIPPIWESYEGIVPDKLPRSVQKLFDQVVGETDRKYFYHWLRTALVGRNTSYLILQGKGGVGKGTMKTIMRALVGNHNFANGKKETITGAFNGALEGIRLSVFDEFKFDMADENTLKEIPNDTISIERKHQNSTKSTKLFVSMVIMNNEKRDNYLSFDSRKFAPIMLSEHRLETIIPKEEIEEMVAKVEDTNSETFDVAFLAQIGRWILKHGDHSDLFPQGEYRGPKFWELCHTSMPAWKRAIIVSLGQTSPLMPKDRNEIETTLADGTLLYSKLENMIKKQQKNNNQKVNWPGDFSGPRSFIEMFRDLAGQPVFEVIDANDPVLGDFYIRKIEEDGGNLL